ERVAEEMTAVTGPGQRRVVNAGARVGVRFRRLAMPWVGEFPAQCRGIVVRRVERSRPDGGPRLAVEEGCDRRNGAIVEERRRRPNAVERRRDIPVARLEARVLAVK